MERETEQRLDGGEGPHRPLPPPVTTTDFILMELIFEIRGLRDDMRLTPVTPIEGTVELREPPKRKR